MNVIGIDIQLYQEHSFVTIIQVLQKEGWRFFGDQVVYLPLQERGDAEEDRNWTAASLERWNEIKQEIARKQALKETVGVKLEWPELEYTISLTFNVRHRLKLLVPGLYPHLLGSKIPDFTWLLTHIALPLEQAQYSILEIECGQDRS